MWLSQAMLQLPTCSNFPGTFLVLKTGGPTSREPLSLWQTRVAGHPAPTARGWDESQLLALKDCRACVSQSLLLQGEGKTCMSLQNPCWISFHSEMDVEGLPGHKERKVMGSPPPTLFMVHSLGFKIPRPQSRKLCQVCFCFVLLLLGS